MERGVGNKKGTGKRDRKEGKAGVLNDDHDLSHSHPAGTAGLWYYVRMDAKCMYWLPYYGASSGTPSRPRPKALTRTTGGQSAPVTGVFLFSAGSETGCGF